MRAGDMSFVFTPELSVAMQRARESVEGMKYKMELSNNLQKEKERMTTTITWKEEPKALRFTDVPLNANFAIDTDGSYGAVYRKVANVGHESPKYLQLEEATGKLFLPTGSVVRLVEVEINIKAKKPSIYL